MMDEYIPGADTSYGLVYRLNYLWAKADREALAGHYDMWELTLDTIFRNLLYRQEIETKINGRDEVVDVKLSEKDIRVWKKIKDKISDAKKLKMMAYIQKKNINQVKLDCYNSIMLYDIWLRKFMQQELKLYMKESSSNPATALFGENFRKRK